jgi:hypothetical protein
MIVIGMLMMLASAGAGAFLGWQIRHVLVRLRIGDFIWTGHLYALLILGALLVCWFLLGAAFVQCRFAERRAGRRSATLAAPAASEAPARNRRPARHAQPARP